MMNMTIMKLRLIVTLQYNGKLKHNEKLAMVKMDICCIT